MVVHWWEATCCQCGECRFDPCSGNQDPHSTKEAGAMWCHNWWICTNSTRSNAFMQLGGKAFLMDKTTKAQSMTKIYLNKSGNKPKKEQIVSLWGRRGMYVLSIWRLCSRLSWAPHLWPLVPKCSILETPRNTLPCAQLLETEGSFPGMLTHRQFLHCLLLTAFCTLTTALHLPPLSALWVSSSTLPKNYSFPLLLEPRNSLSHFYPSLLKCK